MARSGQFLCPTSSGSESCRKSPTILVVLDLHKKNPIIMVINSNISIFRVVGTTFCGGCDLVNLNCKKVMNARYWLLC